MRSALKILRTLGQNYTKISARQLRTGLTVPQQWNKLSTKIHFYGSTATNTTFIMNSEKLVFSEQNVFVKQLYTGCLAEGSYYVESNNEIAIIDPLRDVNQYLKIAEERNSKIKYIFLTHFHADFVSGHIDLQRKTGAKIIYGPNAQANFEFHLAKDGEEFQLGNSKVVLLHTPGHTMESSCFLLVDQNKPKFLFTGDTLFLGEVGRPDLAVKGDSLTKEQLAGYLYDSLHTKILNLPDDVIVLPGHGAGSPCGKAIQSGTHDLLGNQKKSNYALQISDKEQFIKTISSDLPVPPSYFFYDVQMNKSEPLSLEDVVSSANKPLTPEQVEKYQKEGVLLVDVRKAKEFVKGFIPGSVQIDLEMTFALWVGRLIKPTEKLLLLTPEGREVESIIRLSRIGYDNIVGWVKGGVQEWQSSGRQLHNIGLYSAEQFKEKLESNQNLTILDVRGPGERVNGYIENSILLPLDQVEAKAETVLANHKKDQILYIHCKAGARGAAACSILRKLGFSNLVNVDGGIDAIRKTGVNLKSATCSLSGK